VSEPMRIEIDGIALECLRKLSGEHPGVKIEIRKGSYLVTICSTDESSTSLEVQNLFCSGPRMPEPPPKVEIERWRPTLIFTVTGQSE
jgi:hypothetical protein